MTKKELMEIPKGSIIFVKKTGEKVILVRVTSVGSSLFAYVKSYDFPAKGFLVKSVDLAMDPSSESEFKEIKDILSDSCISQDFSLIELENLEKHLGIDVWPFNFAKACFTDSSRHIVDMTADEIICSMDRLTPREKIVVAMTFKYDMTLKEIGDAFGVTANRIQQIKAKAMRKFRYGFQRIIVKRANDVKNTLYSSFKEEYGIEDTVDPLDPTIDELELSVRSYNCLRRKGINYITELLDTNVMDIIKLRNLGLRSLGEIISRLEGYAKIGKFGDEISKKIFETLDAWKDELGETQWNYIQKSQPKLVL